MLFKKKLEYKKQLYIEDYEYPSKMVFYFLGIPVYTVIISKDVDG